MSKIVSMSSGAIDPINVTKKVFWRPVTSTTVLKVGQPVCYNSDCVCDHKERTSDPTHLGLTDDTYAEGEQEFTGRLFIVEEPLTANLMSFAGIVKSLGPKAGADGDMIEIFTPVEGAVVPVYTDQYAYADRTIMGIRNAEADVSYPGVPIGIALEDKDRSSTAGLVWMRFHKFTYDNQNEALQIEDECGTTCIVNRVNIKTSQTAGRFTAFEIKVDVTGTPACTGYGIAFYTEISMNGVATGQNAGVSHWTNFNAGGDYATSYYGMEIGIYESGADLSGISGSDILAPLCLRVQLDSTDGAGSGTTWMMYFRSDGAGDQPDGLFCAYDSESINGSVVTSGTTCTHHIPIKIEAGGGDMAAGTYYLMVKDTA